MTERPETFREWRERTATATPPRGPWTAREHYRAAGGLLVLALLLVNHRVLSAAVLVVAVLVAVRGVLTVWAPRRAVLVERAAWAVVTIGAAVSLILDPPDRDGWISFAGALAVVILMGLLDRLRSRHDDR